MSAARRIKDALSMLPKPAVTPTGRAATWSEVSQLYEKLSVTVNTSELAPLFSAILSKCTAEPQLALRLAQRVAENEVQWLGIMQRVLSDDRNWCGEVASLIKLLAETNQQNVRRVLVLAKLSHLLTLSHLDIRVTTQLIITCAQQPVEIEILFKRMQGIENFLSAISTAERKPENLSILLMTVAHLIGRCPGVTQDLITGGLDAKLASVGVANIPHIKTQQGASVMRAVLYCLRFFVRLRSTNIAFVECCLSLCAHSVSVLQQDATELCGDICAVVTDMKFAKTNNNVFLNTVSLVQHILPNRSLHVLVFLRRIVPQSNPQVIPQFAPYSVVATNVLIMKLEILEPSIIEQTLSIYHICVRHAGVPASVSVTNFLALEKIKDAVMAEEFLPEHKQLLLSFCQLTHLYLRDKLICGLKRVWINLSELITAEKINAEDYKIITGNQYNERALNRLELNVQRTLVSWMASLGEVDKHEAEERRLVAAEESSEIGQLMDTEHAAFAHLLKDPKQIFFQNVYVRAQEFMQQRVAAAEHDLDTFVTDMKACLDVLKKSLAKRYDEAVKGMMEALKGRLTETALPQHEIFEIKVNHKEQMEKLRKEFKDEKDKSVRNIEWKLAQGQLTRKLLVDYYRAEVSNPVSRNLLQIALEEEIVRGVGWFGISSGGILKQMMHGSSVQSAARVRVHIPQVVSIKEDEKRSWLRLMQLAASTFGKHLEWFSGVKEQTQKIIYEERRRRQTIHAEWSMGIVDLEEDNMRGWLQHLFLNATDEDREYAEARHFGEMRSDCINMGASMESAVMSNLLSPTSTRNLRDISGGLGNQSFRGGASEATSLLEVEDKEAYFRTKIERREAVNYQLFCKMKALYVEEEVNRNLVHALRSSHIRRQVCVTETLLREVVIDCELTFMFMLDCWHNECLLRQEVTDCEAKERSWIEFAFHELAGDAAGLMELTTLQKATKETLLTDDDMAITFELIFSKTYLPLNRTKSLALAKKASARAIFLNEFGSK